MRISDNNSIKIKIVDRPLLTHYRLLGVEINSNPIWKEHVNIIAKFKN